jgi:arsenate reductase
MAEGWAHHVAEPGVEIQSAGIEAHGKNPRAIAVMQEAGLDISAQESTVLSDEMLERADYVVTVCGNADQNCPILPAGTRKEHWPLDDPAKAVGTEGEVLDVFRASRDDIHRRVTDLFERITK